MVYRVWPDFPVQPLIDRSGCTIKADAAFRSYAAAGHGVTWAVLDSGIDQQHPHFKQYGTLLGEVAHLHRDFTDPDGKGDPLTDGMGHGTHVAGIIAGGLAPRARGVRVLQQLQDPDNPQGTTTHERKVDPALLSGIAPHAKLVSLKVLDDQGRGSSMNIVRALEHIRTHDQRPEADARARGQPERRLRVRPEVVRLRAEPALRRGRPAGPVGRGGRGRGGQHRLRRAQLASSGSPRPAST